MRYGWLLTALVALCAPPGALAIEIRALQPGAWAALQPPERRFEDCNSLIVAGDDHVVVVDAQESADDVRRIIAFVEDEIRKPVRFLVNTHWHGDHTRGNTIYRETYGDDLVIVGHATHPEDIARRAEPALRERVEALAAQLPAAREQLRTRIKRDGSTMTDAELAAQTARVEEAERWVAAQSGARFTPPSLTVNDVYAHEAGAASFTLHPLRGHTRGDIVVHFPGLGLVATGDLVDVVPYVGHGYPREWLSALAAIARLEARRYVPGHGGVLEDAGLADGVAEYLRSLTSQVDALARGGATLEQVSGKVDLSASRARLAGDDERARAFFDEVQGEAIERAYAEAKGTID
jgi:glyoxylase-like metal-dependent hydrolase (beta-lactamase superfamily II)